VEKKISKIILDVVLIKQIKKLILLEEINQEHIGI